MTPKQQAAMRQLALALGVRDKPPIPKDLAGRVLLEATNAMAGGVTMSGRKVVSVDHGATSGILDAPKPPPDGSATAELHKLMRDDEQEHVQHEEVSQPPSRGEALARARKEAHEAARQNWQETISKAFDSAFASVLAAHGINTNEE